MDSRDIVRTICLFGLLLGAADCLRAEEASGRVVTGLSSSQKLIDDLEYMVVGLADKQTSWDDNVFPNIDIFLIGVDPSLPVRFDVLLRPDEGQIYQPIIPVADLEDFLDNNLDPIGIEAKRDRRDRTLYELSGTVYEGWLRSLTSPNYVVISKRKDDVPKGMTHPHRLHKELIRDGSLVFVLLDNSNQELDQRQAAYATFKENTLEDVQKRPDESRAAFELRSAIVAQQLDLLGMWFTEAERVEYHLTIDPAQHEGISDLLFSSIPETGLAASIDRIEDSPSRFAALKPRENSILSLRVNFPVDPRQAENYRQVYQLARPVLEDTLHNEESASPGEKEARVAIAHLLLDILTESSELGIADGFVDVFPNQEQHTALLGVRTLATDKIQELISKLGEGIEQWSVEMNVDRAGDVPIHKLLMGTRLAPVLSEYYGDSGEIFLAVSEETFWLAGGVNALEELKQAIATVANSEPGKPDQVLLDLTMKMRPVLDSFHRYLQEEDLAIFDLLRKQISLQQTARRAEKAEQGDESERRSASLADFEWQETAIAALSGADDTLHFKLVRSESGALTGEGLGAKAVLKAVGAVIAQFADENLQ